MNNAISKRPNQWPNGFRYYFNGILVGKAEESGMIKGQINAECYLPGVKGLERMDIQTIERAESIVENTIDLWLKKSGLIAGVK